GELAVDVGIDSASRFSDVDPRVSPYPRDAQRAATVARARVWLDSLDRKPISGLHLEGYARLAIAAGDTALAMRELTARLNGPGLSIDDRAFVLYVAVAAFATPEHPEWLPIAERYAEQLSRLGTPTAGWDFLARHALMVTHYRLGQSNRAIEEGERAFAL